MSEASSGPSAQLYRQRWIGLAMGSFLFLAGLFMVAGSWQLYRIDLQIQQQGTRVSAQILKKEYLGDSEYGISYVFSLPDGQSQRSHRQISKQDWQRLQPGQWLPVAYHPDDPSRSFPTGLVQPSLTMPLFVTLIAGLVGCMGGVLLWASLRCFVRGPRRV